MASVVKISCGFGLPLAWTGTLNTPNESPFTSTITLLLSCDLDSGHTGPHTAYREIDCGDKVLKSNTWWWYEEKSPKEPLNED